FFYLLLTLLGFIIAYKARTRQGRIIAFGMSAFIGLQAFINIGVICGALPTKGMPAPLISYGGSNLMTCLAAIGLIFSVALDTVKPDYADRIHERLFAFFRKNKK
ncbi:MAG: FtsW/RodA/SpoVE family cell cycle protein, partial [Lentisphaeria bacterium]|nr:FtsW/RodA/SpoVE family cell cycle protein [Lentisphaeria bacterium]